MKRENKIIKINIASNLILQFVIVVSGLIIPRLILTYFGSEVNGLVSSLTQFLSYIELVEGGITAVIISKLYKPMVKKDYDTISSIYVTAANFYRKVGIIFFCYALLVATLYPMLFNTSFSFIYIFTLTLILAINFLIQYVLSLSLRSILIADKKVYIVSIAQIIICILGVVFGYISVLVYPKIHMYKFICGILFLLQPIIFRRYVYKHYKINRHAKVDNSLIKERWDGFFNNIAYFINTSTDISLLTIFTNLKTVSIYSVYSYVTIGMRSVINAIINAITPSIGQSYAKDDSASFLKKFDLLEYANFSIIFILLNVTFNLISPFVIIYTKGLSDANYYQPIFGYLFVIAIAIELLKYPYIYLAYYDNRFKEMSKYAFIEAIINITISIILIGKYGLVGVMIGTIVCGIYRLIYQLYLTKKIVNRRYNEFIKKAIIYAVFSIIGFVLCNSFIKISSVTLTNFIMYGFIYILIYGILYMILSCIFYRDSFLSIIKGKIRN